jgi:hypothetical protein
MGKKLRNFKVHKDERFISVVVEEHWCKDLENVGKFSVGARKDVDTFEHHSRLIKQYLSITINTNIREFEFTFLNEVHFTSILFHHDIFYAHIKTVWCDKEIFVLSSIHNIPISIISSRK